jgi:hypothetical protein
MEPSSSFVARHSNISSIEILTLGNMADITNADREKARILINGIFNNELGDDNIDEGLTIYDVERDYYDFEQTRSLARDFNDGKMPALQIGEYKVPFSTSVAMSGASFPFAWYYQSPRRILREYFFRSPDAVMVDHEEATKTFRTLAGDFLAARIASLRDRNEFTNESGLSLFRRWRRPKKKGGNGFNGGDNPPGGRISISKCMFTVSSNSAGLNVLWSGAYYIVRNSFGSPTTPVHAPLPSGNYVFGVDGGAYTNPQWDPTIIALPGPTTNHHLHY